jgi:hypothetical protein
MERDDPNATQKTELVSDRFDWIVSGPARHCATVEGSNSRSVDIVEPGKRVRLHFRDYMKPGDDMAIDLEPANHRIPGATVNTYLDAPDDVVAMDIRFGNLADGATYPASVNLNAKAKNISVQVTNSDYRLIGG